MSSIQESKSTKFCPSLPLLKAKQAKKVTQKRPVPRKQKIQENSKENSTEAGKRSYQKWGIEMEKALLQEYAKDLLKFNDKHQKQISLWQKLATRMKKRGFDGVSYQSCFRKFDNLRKRYKELLYNEDLSEQNKSELDPHYETMNDLFSTIVDDKIRIKKEIMEEEYHNQDVIDKTIESIDKTQYIIEVLEESQVNDEEIEMEVRKIEEKEDSGMITMLDADPEETETLYIEKRQYKLDFNTPLCRNKDLSVIKRSGNLIKRSIDHQFQQEVPSKILKTSNGVFIKPEPLSALNSYRTSKSMPLNSTIAQSFTSKPAKIQIGGNGKIQLLKTPAIKQSLPDFNLSALEDDNGMISVFDSARDQSEISTIEAHESSNTMKAETFRDNDSNSIKNQPQSTLLTPNVSLVKIPANKSNGSFLSPPSIPRGIKVMTNTSGIGPKYSMKLGEVTIANNDIKALLNSTKTKNSESTVKLQGNSSNKSENEIAPVWFQAFVEKFDGFVKRQDSIEQRLMRIEERLGIKK